ncbi:hypothetical protein [Polynucleobacter sp. IMCC 30228]|uniref:hypothetical protein n=1 Tax=Polynucleobacter sp. IMCC 30228 TaxID=2781011 RepID=UPI001F485BC1|nr:hypothetical protein [Polynucleobacter sp. IMCC 30228]MCE7527846.1 hypothetical protein [Polynucleobacter sp. IMCC 30228]
MHNINSSFINYLPISPLIGILLDVIAHIILSRINKKGAHVGTQFISIAIGLIVTLSFLIFLLWDAELSLLNNISYGILYCIIYLEFAFILFNIINANVSSLRVRMLKEYAIVGEKGLSDEVLLRKYSASEILAVRIERLTAGNQIYLNDNRYFARKGGVAMIAVFFNGLRFILLRNKR